MRKIKAKHATKKELEFLISQISKLDVIEFIGIAKLCGVKLIDDSDAATVIEEGHDATENKPKGREFYDILADILDYYQNAKKEKRQTLINIIIDCVHEKKKRGDINGTKSENSPTRETIST